MLLVLKSVAFFFLKGKNMSKIKELLNDNKSVLVFDIDGVLALLEFGEYNHFDDDEEEWFNECTKGINHYTEDKVVKKMQNFIRNKDTNRIYIISAIGHSNEAIFKKEFAEKFYNIPKENVYCVEKRQDKKNCLFKIKEKYPDLEDFRIIMIDDTVSILDDIMQNTNFSTIHISSFLDI